MKYGWGVDTAKPMPARKNAIGGVLPQPPFDMGVMPPFDSTRLLVLAIDFHDTQPSCRLVYLENPRPHLQGDALDAII